MRNNIAIILPCYNAKNTIIQAINGIISYLPEAKIIIVDDNSPDKSSDLIKKRFHKDKRINLINRSSKQGRGSAIHRGFSEALKDRNIEFFIEMDADLCHNPKYIPTMINKCKTYDVVIASKYLKESEIKGLNTTRYLFSKIANFYLKLILQVPITDYTNGFRCYKRGALEKIDFNSFNSKGFIVLSEIIYKIYKNGCTLAEIPFIFNNIGDNKSNFNLSEIKEAFVTILNLKFNFR